MIQIKSTFPVLVTPDLGAQKDFYVEHFGFNVEFFDATFYLHLADPATGNQLAFMAPDHASQPDFLHPVAGKDGMVMSFEVADIQSAWTAAKAANMNIVFDLKEEAFGLTHFMVTDPGGFVVDILQDHNA